MKQHITGEQFTELTFEQSVKLLGILGVGLKVMEGSEELYKNNKELIRERFSYYIKQLNIGKMIEILVTNVPMTQCIEDNIDIEIDRRTNSCSVEYRKNNFEFVDNEAKEICDALWEAVKGIL